MKHHIHKIKHIKKHHIGLAVMIMVLGVMIGYQVFAQQVPSGGGVLNTGTNQQPLLPPPSNTPPNGGVLNPNSGTQQVPTSVNQIPQLAPPINQPLVIPPAPLKGWLWSDMPDQSDQNKTCTNNHCGRGLGWISLNSTDPVAVSTIPYGAILNMNNGLITGYGWSEYGGWLHFQPSGTFPVGNSTFNGTARVDGQCMANVAQTNCRMAGWARFVAGTDPQAPAWDGWVSMSGKTAQGTDYGVFFNKQTGKFSGFAWGADVSGWIDFSKASIEVPPDTIKVCTDPNATNDVPLPLAANQISDPYVCQYPPDICTVTPSACPESFCDMFPTLCITASDMCPKIPGDQQPGNFPMQYNGTWYGSVGGICKPDACPDTLDSYTQGFQAIVPFTVGNMSYNIDPVDGVCKRIGVVNPTDPTNPGGTNPINPIYKEN